MTQQPSSAEAMAQRAWDELCIKRTLARVAHAQDNLDKAAYRKCFTENVLLSASVMMPDWEPKEISAEELSQITYDNLSKYDAVHHMIFNHIIDVQGDEATCDADLHALSVLAVDGETTNITIGGRYFMRLVRVDGEWLIRERSVKARYQFGDLELKSKAAARAGARHVKSDPGGY